MRRVLVNHARDRRRPKRGGGLSVEDAGKALAISRAVAYRNWKYARAWLRAALEK
jgi:hypothetical protein